MTQTYHAVVWIDHREARVFHFDRVSVDKRVVHPEHPSHQVHHRGNTNGGHGGADPEFLASVVKALGASEAILLTGPGAAKTELVK